MDQGVPDTCEHLRWDLEVHSFLEIQQQTNLLSLAAKGNNKPGDAARRKKSGEKGWPEHAGDNNWGDGED